MSDSGRSAHLKIQGSRNWTRSDDEWQRQALRQQLDALPALRASAERWTGGLATLLGAVSLGALLAGPGRFDALDQPYGGIAKALFFLSALACALALTAALLAGSSTNKKLFLSTGPAIREASRVAVRSALTRLAISRWSAGVAVALLLCAGFLIFFAPREPEASTPSSAIPAQTPEPSS